MSSSAHLAKLKEWAMLKAAIGVSICVPDVPGSLIIFAEEGPDAVTLSLERDDTVLSLSSGDPRILFFLSAIRAISLEGVTGHGPEAISLTFPGGKLRIWKR